MQSIPGDASLPVSPVSVDWSNPATWVPAVLTACFILYYFVQSVRKDRKQEQRDDAEHDRKSDFTDRVTEITGHILTTSNEIVRSMSDRLEKLEAWKSQMQADYDKVLQEKSDLIAERGVLIAKIKNQETQIEEMQLLLNRQSTRIVEIQDELDKMRGPILK